ncbi:hypothetical protein BDY24DRAFT_388937 [Mrakia frigida]|uniref:uncharacterized protein n=1 Tax=Mrakia frigida TaxID=29902 RepID=UPI003FCBF903
MNKIAPRRRLPWDVLLLVFKQADPSTLAVLGRVSHDFLTATAQELYKLVAVTSVKQLEGFFCKRTVAQEERKTKTSRINPHLSLSHIHTLIIDFTSLSSRRRVPNSLSLSSSRLDDQRPLLLEHLEVSSDYSKVEVLRLLYSSLFPRLNPTRCSYKIVGRALPQAHWVHLSHNYPTQLLGWTQIQTLDLSGVFPRVFLNGQDHLAGLPPPFPDHRRVLRLRVASLLSSSTGSESIMDIIGRNPVFFGLEEMQDGSIVLVVKSEEEKREAEAAVQTSQRIERWRHVFIVELET